MTAARPYRDPISAGEAVKRIQAESGRQFDPAVVSALRRGVARRQMRFADPPGRVPITG
jgi:HD-GYP domain-containing protein (c-di-GMP phosphodiesterase class II)